MLNRDTLERSYQFTEQLDAAGFYLRPIAGSVLGSLVEATRSSNNFMVGDGTGANFEPSIADIEFMANQPNPGTGVSDHDAVQESACAMGLAGVTNQINTIRTQVGPAVAEMAEKTLLEMQAMTSSKLLGMEVVVYNPPIPLMDDKLEKEARRTEGVPYDNPVLGLALAPMSVADMIKTMETGMSSVDAGVKQWAATKGDSFFITVWETFFMVNDLHGQTNKVLTLRDFMDVSDDAPEVALTIFLLARKLWDNPPPDTAMNLEQYEKLMTAFRNQAANSLVRHIEMLQSKVASGILVLKTQGMVTTVLGPIYNDWLDQDKGENEILFGNIVADNTSVTRDDLNANRAALLAKWNQYDMVTKMTEESKRFTRIKEVMREVFRQQIYEATNGEEHAEEIRQRVTEMFETELRKVTDEDTRDIYGLALKLLCRSRFVATDAEMFLGTFSLLKKENPECSDDEIAAVCSLKYVIRFLVEQVEVVKAQ